MEKIENLSEIVRIECGYHHSMCIDNYDNLYVFGCNNYGQLGLGDTDNRNTPIKNPSLSNIIDISRGGYHTLVKTLNNEIYAFGHNKQLGIENDINSPQLEYLKIMKIYGVQTSKYQKSNQQDLFFANNK